MSNLFAERLSNLTKDPTNKKCLSVSNINIEGTGPVDNLSGTLGPVCRVMVAWTHIFILPKSEKVEREFDSYEL